MTNTNNNTLEYYNILSSNNFKFNSEFEYKNTLINFKNTIYKYKAKYLLTIIPKLFNENKIEIVKDCYYQLGHDEFIQTVIKTINIYINGGLNTIQDVNKKRSIGGIFMYIVKKESNLSKKQLLEIFKKDYKLRNNKRKAFILLKNLNLNSKNQLN